MSRPGLLREVAAVVRWRDWGDSKLPLFVAAVCYAALLGPATPARAGETAAVLLLLCLYAAFGHVLNDHADRALDLAAGKTRRAARSETGCLWLALLLAAGCLSLSLLLGEAGTLALTAGALLLAALYSLEPVRLKQRGWLGWIAASLAQRVLPPAIAFQTLGAWDWGSLLICLHGAALGFRFIGVHQLIDSDSDAAAGLGTVATRIGPKRLARLLRRVVFPAEILLLLASLAAIGPTAPVAAGVGVCYVAIWLVARPRGRRPPALTYSALFGLYSLLLPLSLAVAAGLQQPLHLLYVPLLVLLVLPKLPQLLRLGALGSEAAAAPRPQAPA